MTVDRRMMPVFGKERMARALSQWSELVRRHALVVVIASVVLCAFLLKYTIGNLGMNTDTADMISRRLDWRQTYLEYKKAFPQFSGELVAVIDGLTPDISDRARDILADFLKAETELFESVYVPGGGAFFDRNGLLYVDEEELYDLSDNLAGVQPFLGRLVRDQSLTGLLGMMEEAMDAVAEGEDLDLDPVMERLGNAFDARVNNSFYQLSWQEILRGRNYSPGDRRRILVLKPRLDFSEPLPGGAAIRRVRDIAAAKELDAKHGVSVRLTGSVALAYDELGSVMKGTEFAGAASLVLVAFVLYFALRSLKMLLASLATLIVGLIFTAGFATYAVGHLNLISVAFAILYIGLGIDYAIHLCLRYRELLGREMPHAHAMKKAVSDVGSSLLLCAITTSAAFYAFVPTSYSGVSELGLISGTGIIISFLVSVTLLPALLSLAPAGRSAAFRPLRKDRGPASRLFSLPLRYAKYIRAGSYILAALSLASLPLVRFDWNPMNLRDSKTESVSTFMDLLDEGGSPPLTISLLASGPETAKESSARLKKLETVDKAVYLNDFVPRNQDEKLAIIDEMALMLGPELEQDSVPRRSSVGDKVTSLGDFRNALITFINEAAAGYSSTARGLLERLERFIQYIDGRSEEERKETLNRLENSIVASLPRQLDRFRSALAASRVDLSDLPHDLVERWVSKDGVYRVEVFPKYNLSRNEAIRRFAEQVLSVEGKATGPPVIYLKAGETVVEAFQQAFITALVLVFVFLFVSLMRLGDSVLVLSSLLLAGMMTGSASVLFDIPFNFANIIGLPLLLGIGVDNGIHMVHRYRMGTGTIHNGSGNLLATGTAVAVLASALTTACSFGSLAFSRHSGTASMGQILAIGILLSLISALIVVPAFLERGKNPRRQGA